VRAIGSLRGAPGPGTPSEPDCPAWLQASGGDPQGGQLCCRSARCLWWQCLLVVYCVLLVIPCWFCCLLCFAVLCFALCEALLLVGPCLPCLACLVFCCYACCICMGKGCSCGMVLMLAVLLGCCLQFRPSPRSLPQGQDYWGSSQVVG
jgi:hypothetical protein